MITSFLKYRLASLLIVACSFYPSCVGSSTDLVTSYAQQQAQLDALKSETRHAWLASALMASSLAWFSYEVGSTYLEYRRVKKKIAQDDETRTQQIQTIQKRAAINTAKAQRNREKTIKKATEYSKAVRRGLLKEMWDAQNAINQRIPRLEDRFPMARAEDLMLAFEYPEQAVRKNNLLPDYDPNGGPTKRDLTRVNAFLGCDAEIENIRKNAIKKEQQKIARTDHYTRDAIIALRSSDWTWGDFWYNSPKWPRIYMSFGLVSALAVLPFLTTLKEKQKLS